MSISAAAARYLKVVKVKTVNTKLTLTSDVDTTKKANSCFGPMNYGKSMSKPFTVVINKNIIVPSMS